MRLVVVLILITLPALAQHCTHDMAAGKVGWVAREILERPVPLRADRGEIHDPVTTRSKQAQAFYNQGIAYIHNYVWIEASRSFHQALRHDPKLAMAHVGLARVFMNMDDVAAARAQLAKARPLISAASKREQRRFAAMEKQLDSYADQQNKEKLAAYKAFLDAALKDFPEDAELWMLRGNSEEYLGAAGRGQRGGEGTIRYYEEAMKRVKDHFGAHHYLIHSYEYIGKIDKALYHGKIYADAASSVPHAHHMYGHDLRRNGNIEQAIERFRRAEQLEKAYYAAEKIDRRFDWHHTHNLNLLATSYQYQGQIKTAEELLRDSRSIPVFNEYQAFFRKDYVEFLLGRSRYDEALSAARELTASEFTLAKAVGHALAGTVHLARKDVESARKELATAEKMAGNITGFAQGMLTPYVNALKAELLLRTGDAEGAAMLKEVQRKLRAVPGPDAWSQALFRLEYMARVAREAGQWELAEHTAREMLDHDPHYGGTHYALGLVAEHKGDRATAAREFAEAARLWSKADRDLVELGEIRKKQQTLAAK